MCPAFQGPGLYGVQHGFVWGGVGAMIEVAESTGRAVDSLLAQLTTSLWFGF
jgi:hypothetical protein